MVEINLEKKHFYLLISILLFFIGAGFVFAASNPAVSHTATEIEGLSDYFLTKGLLNPRAVECPVGQCLKELDVRGNQRCEQYTAPASLTNDWVDVKSSTSNCATLCNEAKFSASDYDPKGYMCIGTAGFGTYVLNGGCAGSVLISCYCTGFKGASTFVCPPQPPQTVTNKVEEPVSCSSGVCSIGSCPCHVACPHGWILEGCDHLSKTFFVNGMVSGVSSGATNHLNCKCVKYF